MNYNPYCNMVNSCFRGPTGPAGATPQIINGNWWVNGVDTGTPAQGPAGATGATGPTGPAGFAINEFVGPVENNSESNPVFYAFDNPEDYPLFYATVNPTYASVPALLNSQILYLGRIQVQEPITVYQFLFSLERPAEGVDLNSSAVIYDEDGAMIHSFPIGPELYSIGVKSVPFNVILQPGTYFLGIFVIAAVPPVLSAASISGIANLLSLGPQARFLQSGVLEIDLPNHLSDVMLEASPYSLFFGLA